VTKNDGIEVFVFPENLLEVDNGVAELIHGEGHVFEDHGCTAGPYRTHGREKALAHFPEKGTIMRIGGKHRGVDQ
jgi:hypothetical protein